MHVQIPRKKNGVREIKAFETNLPLFRHEVGNFKDAVFFDYISLRSSNNEIRTQVSLSCAFNNICTDKTLTVPVRARGPPSHVQQPDWWYFQLDGFHRVQDLQRADRRGSDAGQRRLGWSSQQPDSRDKQQVSPLSESCATYPQSDAFFPVALPQPIYRCKAPLTTGQAARST